MFGYIIANKKALTFEQRDRYQGAYCGLCRQLKKDYGATSRMCLSYDMVFLLLTVNALYELPEEQDKGRCFVHPAALRPRITTEATCYAADLSVIFTYEKLLDDLSDEKSTAAKIALGRMQRAYDKACARSPQKAEAIKERLKSFYAAEKRSADTDELANLFGRVMAEAFCFKKGLWEQELSSFGEALGRFIYLLDAYADFDRDKKKGRFNPLESARDESILKVLMGEAADAFERLPIVQDAELLRHIIYCGVWLRYDMQKKKGRGIKSERPI